MLNPRKGTYVDLDDAAADLWRHDGLRRELLELLPLLEDQIVHLHQPLGLLHPVPLQVHASYTREEILAAFGASTVTTPLPLQTGVYWHEPTRTDLLFVTLQKTEKDYSPTTRYLDYAISEHLFHWETQAKHRRRQRAGAGLHPPRGARTARSPCSSAPPRTTPTAGPCRTSAPAPPPTSSTSPSDPSRSRGGSTTRSPATSSPPTAPPSPS